MAGVANPATRYERPIPAIGQGLLMPRRSPSEETFAAVAKATDTLKSAGREKAPIDAKFALRRPI